MTGQIISHYRVLEKLGEGGMGAVYKAVDLSLGRVVALKFITGGDRARFMREARAAAALNHPNICTIHEVDGENSFLAMEYVEGNTLKEKIAGRPLPVSEALRIALPVAAGLQAAHERGIVHRDIKPANILLDANGQVKIADFGLAQFADGSLISVEGALSGTPAYMAPEQMRGEQVDRRADIWALGAVLHEMLTGRVPAGGLIDPLPAGLDRVVQKALAPDAADRYQHVADMAVDLRTGSPPVSHRRAWIWGAAAAGVAAAGYTGFRYRREVGRPAIRSLAVLPLRNLSRDPEQEFFSDATTEALITSLSQIRSLKVISRTSAMRFKNTDKTLADVASQLGVDGIVEGSIQRSNQRVRVSVRLIHASSDANLWARDYDRDMSDVLLLQSEVARAIAQEIRAAITPGELGRLSRAQSRNPDAQDAYLLGRYYYWRPSERNLTEAIRQFERAVQLDPNFASAFAGLSDAWRERGVWGALSMRQVEAKARAAALKALELDPDLAAGHCALAFIKQLYDWHWIASEEEFGRALAGDPNSVDAHWGYSLLLMALGRFPQAISEIERAAALDPLSATIHSSFGRILYRARRYEQAKALLARAMELDPQDLSAYTRLADVFEATGDYEHTLELRLKSQRVRGIEGPLYPDALLARTYALMGRTEDARRMVDRLTADEKSVRSTTGIAWVYFALGDLDRGFQWYEKAFERRDLVIFDKFDPKFDSVRSDPRFQALMKRLNIPDNGARP